MRPGARRGDLGGRRTTEAAIIAEVDALFAGRTRILISHRGDARRLRSARAPERGSRCVAGGGDGAVMTVRIAVVDSGGKVPSTGAAGADAVALVLEDRAVRQPATADALGHGGRVAGSCCVRAAASCWSSRCSAAPHDHRGAGGGGDRLGGGERRPARQSESGPARTAAVLPRPARAQRPAPCCARRRPRASQTVYPAGFQACCG